MDNLSLINEFYQNNKEGFSDNFRLKIHRSLSWLRYANENEELDIKFITLWIAFNSAYAKDLQYTRPSDKATFVRFLRKICKYDKESLFHQYIWQEKTQSIVELLENKFTYQPFWDYQNKMRTERSWSDSFKAMQKNVINAVKEKNTFVILNAIFAHLYTLRNQILHGGATFNSRVNRKQLETGCDILGVFIPAMIDIMMKNHSELDWGKPFYPVVQD